MKILWLSHFVPFPPAGGALQRTYHLLRHAAAQHEVHLLALRQPKLLPTTESVAEAVTALSGMCASVRVFQLPAERSRVHRLYSAARSVVGTAPFDVTWLRSHAMGREIDTWRRDGGVDLVHVDTVGLWPYADQWGGPVVLGHHNIESDLVARRAAHERSAWRSALIARDSAKLRALEVRAGERAAMNLVVSALDEQRLHAVAPEAQSEVVDNGVDTEYWTPRREVSEGNGIVFAGTLGWYPNRDAVDFLLAEIWPTLAATGPQRRLTLVGRDPAPNALAAAADPRITVTGFVPDVRPFLDSASICVCPIRVGGGTRLKVLDALAMEKPLVSTAVGVEGLGLAEGTHYLRAETGSEFVGQIERLERSPELRASLGIAGRRLAVERFDWRVIGRKLDIAYERALMHRPSPRPTGA